MESEHKQEMAGNTSDEESVSKHIDAPLLALYVSAGLTYTWYALSFLFFGISQILPADIAPLLDFSPLICSLIGILSAYLLLPRYSLTLDYGKRKQVLSGIYVFLALGVLLLFLALVLVPDSAVISIPLASLILGAAIGAIGLFCMEFACGLERGPFVMCVCVAVIIGVGIFCLSSALETLWQIFLFPILTILGAVAVFAFTAKLHPEDSPERIPLSEAFKKLDLNPKTGWFLALYGNVVGLKSVELLAMRLESDFFTLLVTSVGFLAGVVIALIVLLKNPGRMLLGKAQRLTFPFLIIGLLPWGYLHPQLFPIGFICIFAACSIFIAIGFDTHYFLSKKYDVPAIYSLTLAFRSFIKGLLSGSICGAIVFTFWATDFSLSLFGLVLVVALSFLIAFIREEPDRSKPEPTPVITEEALQPVVKKPGLWKECCMSLVEEYNLTPREADILMLLLKAYTVERISSTLFISTHTAKTHIYHIYQKLGIGSRGELSELFEKKLETLKEQHHN